MELQKAKRHCGNCGKTTAGFLIPDGRFICGECSPQAILDRWESEWTVEEKSREKAIRESEKQVRRERQELERLERERERIALKEAEAKENFKRSLLEGRREVEPEMTGWATSASLGQVFSSLLTLNHKSPAFNFLNFAFPVLIRTIWWASSWILIIGSIAIGIVLPLQAIGEGRAQYLENNQKQDEERREYCTELMQKSSELIGEEQGFLQGKPLDEDRLLRLKRAIRDTPTVHEVLFSDKTVRSILGTAGFEEVEELSENVTRVKVGSEARLLVKIRSVESGENRWIGVIWDDKSFVAHDPTSVLLTKALLTAIVQLVLLTPVLLWIRLLCETAILWFRFIDEIVAIHNTMKRQARSLEGK